MTNRAIAFGFIFLFVALLGGCASVNLAPPEQDSQAKQFRSKSNVSQVYIYRDQILGSALSIPVKVNGKLLGNTGPKSYFLIELPAGNHVSDSQEGKSTLKLTTRRGRIYFVRQEIVMGFVSGNTKLSVVDAATGKEGVGKSKRIQSSM